MSSRPPAADGLNQPVDHYIPTPNADGTCDPHIHDAGEGRYWVVCKDCSTELVEGRANALAKLEDCDGGSEG